MITDALKLPGGPAELRGGSFSPVTGVSCFPNPKERMDCA